MGDVNQLTYLKRFSPSVSGPILEIGSKDYGSTSSFREFYSGEEYIGIDMESGKNVDLVVDLTKGVAGLRKDYFALGICCSVLEHVRKPWVFAEHLTSVLRAGGVLYMSVPWVWRYHAYPDDYFRFSWRGVMELFPEFVWSNICYSTNVPNEFINIVPDNPGIDNTMAVFANTPSGNRKYLPYLMVNMLGHKNTSA
jgi:SAM-dependent methyltransferase